MQGGNLSLGWFVLVSVIKVLIAVPILLTIVAYTVWLERKLVGHIQNRGDRRAWARSACCNRSPTA
jgi:NADH:ubiquinone oxidoreductase subunit H